MSESNPSTTRATERAPIDPELSAALRATLFDWHESLAHRLALLEQELPREVVDGSRTPGDAELVRVQYERTQAQVLEVAAALERFDAGDYGICTVCTKPIEIARLEALPETARCLACVGR